MKSNKKRVFLVLAILTMAILLSFVFVACDKKDDPSELTATEIYSRVNPSVVFVLIETKSGYSSGSGFFIDTNGMLVTNYHVIEDGLSGEIQLNDGKTATIDKVIGFDKKMDIAILATSATNTKPITVSKTPVQIGDSVYAIGYPEAFKLGISSSTFTTGIVSMNRTIDDFSYIQSTVDITHGNSGGALINKLGEVVGITTAGITFSNINYMNLSIPIQRIEAVSRDVNVSLEILTRRNHPVYATFYSDDNIYTIQSIQYEGCAYEPATPEKNGYSFAGWYSDNFYKSPFNFNTKLIRNVSIYAKWDIISYSLNYNLNTGFWEGSSPPSTYTINDCGKALPIPKKEGYIFEGWKDSSGNYISNLPASNSLTNLSLLANWVKGTEGLLLSTNNTETHYVAVTGYIGNEVNIVIPKTYRGIPVKEIMPSSFRNQTQIKSIVISDYVTSIGERAFKGCTGLTSVSIGNNVTSICKDAFEDCANLTSIYYTGDIAGWCGISGLGDLMSKSRSLYIDGNKVEGTLVIPDSVTSIGNNAFVGCSELTGVTIPNSVTSIGISAFFGCNNLEKIYIYDLMTWYNISGLSYLMGYGSSNKKLYVNGSLIKDLVLHDNVTTIPDYAFLGCTMLTSITGSATSVSAVARQAKPSSFSVNITDGTSIDSYAFYDCTGLTSITIPDSIKSIGNYAFSKTGLTSVTIPDSVTNIESGAFSGCTRLTNITGSATNASTVAKQADSTSFTVNITSGTIIGGAAFRDCTGLTSIIIPDSVTCISASAFKNCVSLTSITIPHGVTSIGEGAFYGCTGLTSLIIPNSVTIIENSVFSVCTGLTGIIIPNNVTSIGENAFIGCTGLTSVTIGNSVTSIGNYAFSGCTGLTSVTIGNGVTSIGASAFSNCSGLTSITIPVSVTKIGNYAFSGTNLTSIIFNDTIELWNLISKDYYWDYYIQCECKVVCTNGTISIG